MGVSYLGADADSVAAVTIHTFATTVPEGTIVLLVGVAHPSEITTAVTWKGTALTALNIPNVGDARVDTWYLLNPSPGAGNIVVTMPAATIIVTGAVFLGGIKASDAIVDHDQAGTTSTIGSCASDTELNGMIVDAIGANQVITSGAEQTQVVNLAQSHTGYVNIRLVMSYRSGDGSAITMTEQLEFSGDWAMATVSLAPGVSGNQLLIFA